MNSLLSKIELFIAHLKENRNITIILYLSNEEVLSVREKVLEMLASNVKAKSGIEILKDDWNIFNLGGVSVCWNFTNRENQFIYGGFQLAGFDNALINDSDFWKIDFSLPPDAPVPEHLAEYKKFNWFEKQAWGGDGRYGCFYREPVPFPPLIYFYDHGAFSVMPLTFEEYFNKMIDSCAIRGWQYFYLEVSQIKRMMEFNLEQVQSKTIIKEMEQSVNLLPKLFPEKDFSYHQKRFKQIIQSIQ